MPTRHPLQRHPLHLLRHEMERILGDVSRGTLLEGWVPGTVPATTPAVNVWETNDTLFAEAEVPGVKQEDLEVYVVGNELTIKGNRAQTQEQTTYHRRERTSGAFVRVVRLPVEIDGDHVEARLRDGVLDVRLPKAATARSRRVPVTTTN